MDSDPHHNILQLQETGPTTPTPTPCVDPHRLHCCFQAAGIEHLLQVFVGQPQEPITKGWIRPGVGGCGVTGALALVAALPWAPPPEARDKRGGSCGCGAVRAAPLGAYRAAISRAPLAARVESAAPGLTPHTAGEGRFTLCAQRPAPLHTPRGEGRFTLRAASVPAQVNGPCVHPQVNGRCIVSS